MRGRARICTGLCTSLLLLLAGCDQQAGGALESRPSLPAGAGGSVSAADGGGSSESPAAGNAGNAPATGIAGHGAGTATSEAGARAAAVSGASPVAQAAAGGGGGSSTSANGGSAATPATDAGGAAMSLDAGGCMFPDQYTRALQITLPVTWPETIALAGGSGPVVVWFKAKYTQQPDGATKVESHVCGLTIPTVTTTALLEGLKFSVDVPMSAFDNPSMPTSEGQLYQSGDTTLFDPGAIVLGATLSDPTGTWPKGPDLILADHDGDQKPGVTGLPVRGDGFLALPVSAAQLEFVDQIDLAWRLRFRAWRSSNDCSAKATQLEPIAFDFAFVGCHVENRGECTSDETRFIAGRIPRFALGTTGTWSERDIFGEASCSEVRAALPAP